MKLDKLLLRFQPYPKTNSPCPKDFIKKEFVYCTGKLFVLLPGWCVTLEQNKILGKKLIKEGYSVLSYEFSPQILSSDSKSTKNCFEIIKKRIRNDIEILSHKHKFSEINVIGVSMGCVHACMIANNNKLVHNLFLVIPGHCLAESMWNGIGTKAIRDEYKKNGITLPMLKKYWSSLAPENNIDKLHTKKMHIFLSRSDIIIPYEYGYKLYELIKKKKYNVTCSENNFCGHLLTAYLFYLNPKKYLFESNY